MKFDLVSYITIVILPLSTVHTLLDMPGDTFACICARLFRLFASREERANCWIYLDTTQSYETRRVLPIASFVTLVIYLRESEKSAAGTHTIETRHLLVYLNASGTWHISREKYEDINYCEISWFSFVSLILYRMEQQIDKNWQLEKILIYV